MMCLLSIGPLVAITIQQLLGLLFDYKYSSGTNRMVYAYFVATGAWFWLGTSVRAHFLEIHLLLKWLVYACLPFCVLSWVAILVGGVGAQGLLDVDGMRASYLLPFWGAQQSLLFAFCYFAACLVTKPNKWTIVCLLLSSYNLSSLNKQGVFVSLVVMFMCAVLWILKAEQIGAKACRLLFVASLSVLCITTCAFWMQTTVSGGLAKDFILTRHFHVKDVSNLGSLFSNDGITTASAGRLDEIWVEAWGRICENPFIGSGFTQTLAGRPDAHNAVLDMLLGMGLLGFIPFFCGIILCLHRGIRSFFRHRNGLKQIVFTCCLLYTLSYIAANMGDVQRVWVSSSTLCGFCLGILFGASPDQVREYERVRRFRPLAKFSPTFRRP
jgi:hypothetical protein